MYHIRVSIINNTRIWRVWEITQGIIAVQFNTEQEAINWVKEILEKDSGAVRV
jgi:hypothetical protein